MRYLVERQQPLHDRYATAAEAGVGKHFNRDVAERHPRLPYKTDSRELSCFVIFKLVGIFA